MRQRTVLEELTTCSIIWPPVRRTAFTGTPPGKSAPIFSGHLVRPAPSNPSELITVGERVGSQLDEEIDNVRRVEARDKYNRGGDM